jgi:arylsulfatase A-like enzyme
VSTVGVYATVLELAGIAQPGPVHVGSLLSAGEDLGAAGPIIAERFVFPGRPPNVGAPLAANRRYRIYRSGRWKLAENDQGELLLFDLDADPAEKRDLAAVEPVKLGALQAELAGWVERLELPALDAATDFDQEPELDPATRERLKTLGYID